MGERWSDRCLLHMRLVSGSLLQWSFPYYWQSLWAGVLALICPLHNNESDFKVQQIMLHPCSKFFCVVTLPLEWSSHCLIWPAGIMWSGPNTISGHPGYPALPTHDLTVFVADPQRIFSASEPLNIVLILSRKFSPPSLNPPPPTFTCIHPEHYSLCHLRLVI